MLSARRSCAQTGIFDVTRVCDAGLNCDAQGYAAAQDGKILSSVSPVAVIAGAALVAMGFVLVVWNGGGSKAAASAWVTPWATGGAF